jgi:hypothetical protein
MASVSYFTDYPVNKLGRDSNALRLERGLARLSGAWVLFGRIRGILESNLTQTL